MKTPNAYNEEEEINEDFLVVPELFGTHMVYPILQDLTNEKLFSRFIKKCEGVVRSSKEYRQLIRYLKDETNLDHCFFYKNVKAENISIELHHYPLTLYDITHLVTKKILDCGELFSTLMIAHEVVGLHYQGLIGLVALDKTSHELAHSGDIIIPVNYVTGNIHGFLDAYLKYIPRDLLTQIEDILTLSDEKAMEHNKKILSFKPLELGAIEDRTTTKKQLEDFFTQ